jgi:hypothetical protein
MTIAVLCEKDKVVGAARFVQIKLFPARAIAPSLTVRVRICPRILFSHIPPLACFFSSTSLLELSVDTFCEGMKQRKGGWMDACGAFSSRLIRIPYCQREIRRNTSSSGIEKCLFLERARRVCVIIHHKVSVSDETFLSFPAVCSLIA